jgi:hypothetical protein
MVRQRMVRQRVVGQRMERPGLERKRLVRGFLELMTMRTRMPRSARTLLGLVVAAGAASVAARIPELSSWSTTDIVAMCAIIGATIIGESFSVKIPFGGETKHVTLTESVFAAALLLGVRPGVLTIAVLLGVATENVGRGIASHKALFNVGSWLAAVTAAEVVFGGMHGVSPLAAVSLAMLAFFVVNASTVIGVIALVTGSSFVEVLRPIARLEVTHAVGDLALGACTAVLWTAAPAALAALALVPVGVYATYRALSPGHGRIAA